MKTNSLLLFTILIFTTLFSAQAQIADQDNKKAILGKWQFLNTEVDVVTSDTAVTAQMEVSMSSALASSLDMLSKITLDFTEDGKIISSIGNNKTYWIEAEKLFMKEGSKTDEVDFVIKGDTLIYTTDMTENLVNKLNMMKQLGVDSGLPEDLVLEKCTAAAYLIRYNEEAAEE